MENDSRFTPTKWASAEDKEKFVAWFKKFVKSGYRFGLFHKKQYRQLSMMFGMIAHYDRDGFYATWFETPQDQAKFLFACLEHPCYGDPAHTWSDVEKELQSWIRSTITERLF